MDVDLKGMFFHGTRAPGIDQLKPSRGGEFGPGVYLTGNEDTAWFYASHVASGSSEPYVLRARVTANNPFVVKKVDWLRMTARSTPKTVQNRLKKKGYDSIVGIALNDYEYQLVVFDPSDVKLLRNNPLLAEPPVAPGKAHRLGSMAEAGVQDFFADVDESVENLYEGVHVTPHPIVATAYAMARRKNDYNDYGLYDVVDPPVLVGFKLDGEEALDADGYVTAKDLHELARQLIADEVTTEDFEDDHDGELQEQYDLAGYTWGPFFEFEPYFGIAYPGGRFGNQPAYDAFVSALLEHMNAISSGDYSEEELRKQALKRAYEIVPQSRIMRDVFEEEVAAVLVLPPYIPAEDDAAFEEAPSPPFQDLAAFEGMETPEEFDEELLEDGTVVYGDASKANRWHGTSLSIARKALPDIFTPVVVNEAMEAGSAYDLEELEEESDEEEEGAL